MSRDVPRSHIIFRCLATTERGYQHALMELAQLQKSMITNTSKNLLHTFKLGNTQDTTSTGSNLRREH